MTRSNSIKQAKPRKDSSRYQAILQATRELVHQNGYRSLSLKAIASRSGVSRNVLYNWWDGNLQCIVEEAILPNVTEWPVPNTGSLKGDLTEFVELSIDSMANPHALSAYLELSSQVIDKPEKLLSATQKYRKPYERLLGTILKNAVQRGEIKSSKPEPYLDHSAMALMISGCALQFAISQRPGKRKSKTLLVESILKLIS